VIKGIGHEYRAIAIEGDTKRITHTGLSRETTIS